MRRLEIVLCVVNVPLLIWCLAGAALPPWTRLLPALALLVMVLHGMVEGIRWPLAPAYLATVYAFLAWSWPRVGYLPGSWSAGGVIGLLTVAAVLGTVLPVFELPRPTGIYPIGTAILHRIDSAREEKAGAGRGGKRELLLQIWYPAERPGPARAYRSRAETTLAKQHLALVKTHAATGIPVAGAVPRYPLVIFSPAWTGRRNQNTVQAEELASHGFVVVGIDHPYGTDLTVFPDGRIVRTMLGATFDYSTEETFQASLKAAEDELQTRTADVRFIVDELERLNRSDPQGLLSGRLDTGRVGIFGHSFGGAVAAEVCVTDPRFKAGVNLDGFLFGKATTQRCPKPFLFLCDDTPIPGPGERQPSSGPARRQRAFILQNAQYIHQFLADQPGGWLTIPGTTHMNFCDSPLYSPVKRWTHAGPIRPKRALEIINTCLVAFFQACVGSA